jgi:Recombination endonuclease VII
MTTRKTCSRCHIPKPLSEFQSDTRYRMGVSGWCKECKRECERESRDRIKNSPKTAIQSKKCRACGIEKAVTCFSRSASRRDGLSSRCNECRSTLEAPQRMTATRASIDRRLWLHFKMRIDDFDAIMDAQNGRCAICDREMAKPMIDHNHATGHVRGILCNRCNSWLAPLENKQFLARATAYLEAKSTWPFSATPYSIRAIECRRKYQAVISNYIGPVPPPLSPVK